MWRLPQRRWQRYEIADLKPTCSMQKIQFRRTFLIAPWLPLQMLRVWWTALCPCCWFWRQRNRKHSLKVYVRSWWSSVRVNGLRSGCSCECFHSVVEITCNLFFSILVYLLLWNSLFSLSNLFHGMDENTPVRHTVYCSLIKVAATCNAIAFIPTELDQVWTSAWCWMDKSFSYPALNIHKGPVSQTGLRLSQDLALFLLGCL